MQATFVRYSPRRREEEHDHDEDPRPGTALRPPTDYRDLLRFRRSLPADVLTSALDPIFTHIDLHTLATRGAYLARRAVTDAAPAAELAAVAKVLADALAAPTAAPVTAVITALRTDPQHTHRRDLELLMLAYRDLLTNPAVVGAPPLRAAHRPPRKEHHMTEKSTITAEENDEPLFGGIKLAHVHNAHVIEEAVRVYLMRAVDGTDTWIVDLTCFGESLCSDYDEPQNPQCRCERPEECADVLDRMSGVDLPGGKELMFMLAASLGYTVTKS